MSITSKTFIVTFSFVFPLSLLAMNKDPEDQQCSSSEAGPNNHPSDVSLSPAKEIMSALQQSANAMEQDFSNYYELLSELSLYNVELTKSLINRVKTHTEALQAMVICISIKSSEIVQFRAAERVFMLIKTHDDAVQSLNLFITYNLDD